MKLPKDILSGTYTKPRIFLCETDKERICQLETTNTVASLKFNAYSELTFDVARVYNNLVTGETKVNPFYNKIEAIRLIELEGFGFFELQGPELVSDGIEEKKSCTAYSLEYTLSQKYLENFYVNRGTADSIEVVNAPSDKEIIPITLYNPTRPNLSLLHLVLNHVYGWKIGHIDPQLQTLSRQFEIDRESVYDFLMNEVCEKFNCYIVFDTINNTVNIYAESLTAKFIGDGATNRFIITPPFSQIGTVSVDGYKTTKWEYNSSTGQLKLEDAPVSGARIEVVDGALTEWETDVFISFDNLSQEINISYDADEIKTKLTVTYGDDYDIREVNLGLPYLTDLSYFYTVDWMGQDLYDAYTAYLQKSNSLQSNYSNNSQEILRINDCISYEENRLSLEYSLVSSVNSQTVGTYYTRHQNADGSYYYSEVSLPTGYQADVDYYSNAATNVNETKMDDLYAALQKYFYGRFQGISEKIEEGLKDLDSLSDSFKFMTKTPLKTLVSNLKRSLSDSQKDKEITSFLDEVWTELGRIPLKELYLASYKTRQETNIKAGWSDKNNENYGYYYPVLLFINSINTAISQRDTKIAEYNQQKLVFQNNNITISNELAMDNNFTESQLIRLSAFLREDELHLDDIIETSQDDISSSFKVKQDAMESGRIELQKLCQPQLQFSMTMANIYALPAFEPIIHQFQLGKVIKVCLRPDYIKQSRLLQVDINFDDFSDFSCEFGELTSLRTQSDIHADLLSQAITAGKSVATNSSYWTYGSDTATATDLKIQQGLLDATTQIKAIDGTQGVVIDKYGIRMQAIDPTTGEIAPEQGWITNNKFLYTDDGFKTTKSVFGKYTYGDNEYYGILAEALVGSLIVGSNIEIGNNSGTLKFDDKGFSVTNGATTFQADPNSQQLINISNGTDSLFYVDSSGQIHITGDGQGLDISENTSISAINQTTEEIKLSVTNETKRAQEVEDALNISIESAKTSIQQTQESIDLRATKEEFEAYKDHITDTYYTKEETNEAVLTVNSEAIEARVQEVKSYVDNNFSNTSEMQSAIELNNASITNTVSERIKIGGKNLLLKSDVEVTNGDYVVNTYDASEFLVEGEEYTISLCVTPSENITKYMIYLSDGYKKQVELPVSGTQKQLATATFTASYDTGKTPEDDEKYGKVNICRGADSGVIIGTPISTIHWVKLERGNKSTDWTPAPEDTSERISQVEQTANGIRSEVAATYATKDELTGYPTTSEMNAAIELSATGITSEVNQTLTGYATVGQIQHYGICETEASVATKVVKCDGFILYKGATISVRFTHENSADSPQLKVGDTSAKAIMAYNVVLDGNSSYNWEGGSIVTFVYDGRCWSLSDSGSLRKTVDLSSQIIQTAESITAEVTRATAAEEDLRSKITINADAIESKVEFGEFGSLIQQNYNSVKMAWNQDSKYIQFTNGEIYIYTQELHNDQTLLMKQNHEGAWYYHQGTTIGKIGTNKFVENAKYRGLVFDLEYKAGYMCWAQKDTENATIYTTKLLYNSGRDMNGESVDEGLAGKPGLHFHCNTYANGLLYLSDTVKTFRHTNGSGGLMATNKNNSSTSGYGVYIDAVRPSDSYVTRFACYSDKFHFTESTSKIIDAGGNSIINNSDARLKTNIQDTQVSAIDKINQIEMKEFDWIEDGSHEEIGMIAQQLQCIIPDLVYEDPSTSKLSIKTNKLIPYLVKAIQELTEYVTGGITAYSLRNTWSDEYTDEEKTAFVEKIALLSLPQEVQFTPITIPANNNIIDDEQKENSNE